MNTPQTAWRNLWRHKRRTLLTLFSIAFGGFLAVMFTALQDKNWAEAIDLAARLGGGHVSVQHHEYQDKPSLKRSVTNSAQIHQLAMRDQRVSKVVDRITGQIMLATSTDSFGAFLVAFDPSKEDEQTMSFLGGIEGEGMFDTSRDKTIILGDTLASNLGIEIGDKVVYTLMDKSGEIVAGLGRLRATIDTGADSLDSGIALLPIDTLRKVLNYAEDESTSVAIYINDQRSSYQVANALGAVIADSQKVYTWDQLQPDLAGMIAMKIGGARVMNIIIMLLVAAGIFNTLFVSVMERQREFGILMAIGYSPWQIFGLVIWESIWLAILGLIGGFILAAWPYYYLSTNGLDYTSILGSETIEVAGIGMSSHLTVGLFPESIFLIIIFVVGSTLAAGLYPAWKASSVNPVESIKLV